MMPELDIYNKDVDRRLNKIEDGLDKLAEAVSKIALQQAMLERHSSDIRVINQEIRDLKEIARGCPKDEIRSFKRWFFGIVGSVIVGLILYHFTLPRHNQEALAQRLDSIERKIEAKAKRP